MKRFRTSYEALPPLSPHSSKYHLEDQTTEQHFASSSSANVYTDCFEDALLTVGDLDPLYQLADSHDGHRVQTNTSNQSEIPNIGVDTQGNCLQRQQVFRRAQQSALQNDNGVLRGPANCAEQPGQVCIRQEAKIAQQYFPQTTTACSYNTNQKSYSVTNQRFTVSPMPTAAPTTLSDFRSTQFNPYSGLFSTSEEARDHRHLSIRFGRQPYIDPVDDPSIKEVEKQRHHHVGRIYDAMTRGDCALDNANSIAMKRWVNGAHYKSDLVEAFAHKVFDCLLVQVKEGFRGWHHNDYVDDDRKGEKEDRDADCIGRLENIIDALEREKTICEDVVNSASQIRMFVNAPIAYANRKYQNRVGNSKRGRTKDVLEPKHRPTKVQRTGCRQVKVRSATTSEVLISRDNTPQFQTPDAEAMPYYSTPTFQQPTSDSISNYLSPRQPLYRSAASAPQVPTGYRRTNARSPAMVTRPTTSSSTISRSAMSPPSLPLSFACNPSIVTKKPTQMSPFMSPSPLSNFNSAPPSSDPVEYPVSNDKFNAWSTSDAFAETPSINVDPSLLDDDLIFPHQTWSETLPPVESADHVDCVEQNSTTNHISLAHLEHTPLQVVGGNTGDQPDFESFWNKQPGVQPFSFNGHKA